MKRPEQGVTLIEILVSITIFAILITGVLTFLPGLLKANRNSGDNLSISTYANGVIEQTSAWWTTKSTGLDAYPNFTAGTLPAGLISPPTGISCTSPTVAVIASIGVAPTVTISRRLLSVTCTPMGLSAVTILAQIGRPQ